MSVDQRKIVDFVGTKPSGEIELTISDHLPWDKKNTHLLILQDKINDYLDFIESGQLFESYPTAKGKKIIICVLLKYHPSGDGPEFLERSRKTITDTGLGFRWEILIEEATA
jgi:hypothetical protein